MIGTHRQVTFKCGGVNCTNEPTMEWNYYIDKSEGNCPQCNRKIVAENACKTAEYAYAMIRFMGFTLCENSPEFMDRNTVLWYYHVYDGVIHITKRSYHNFNRRVTCSICVKHKIDFNQRIKEDFYQLWKAGKIGDDGQEIDDQEEEEAIQPIQEPDYAVILAELGHTIRFIGPTKVVFKCEHGYIFRRHKADITSEFRCNHGTKDGQAFSQDDAVDEILKHGGVLLSKYLNYSNLLEIHCIANGHINFISTCNFRKCGCSGCTQTDVIESKRLQKIGHAKRLESALIAKGYKFNDSYDNYVDNRTRLNITCPNNHKTTTCLDDFINGCRGCITCWTNSQIGYSKMSPEEADEICDMAGLELRSEYNSVKDICKFWCCKCKRTFNSTLANIKYQSSGCKLCNGSIGEQMISRYLEQIDIDHVREYRFEDCRNKNELPFDIYATAPNGVKFIIEIDGLQHFEPIEFFGGAEQFESTRRHDMIKTRYCIDNGIPILRISCHDFGIIPHCVSMILADIESHDVVDAVWYSCLATYNIFHEDLMKYQP
jgi:hypothetical protein